jgi:hypothetical protein
VLSFSFAHINAQINQLLQALFDKLAKHEKKEKEKQERKRGDRLGPSSRRRPKFQHFLVVAFPPFCPFLCVRTTRCPHFCHPLHRVDDQLTSTRPAAATTSNLKP